MVGIRSRMRILNTLLGIRFGPGALILPQGVTRIHLAFAQNWNNGHLGPRRFWRDCLPRLKYHNPLVSMTVQRTADQSSKPLLTIHYADSSTRAIDMQMKMQDAILAEFVAATQALPVLPDAEEIEELRKVQLMREKSEEDRARTRRYNDKLREDRMLLERAKESLG